MHMVHCGEYQKSTALQISAGLAILYFIPLLAGVSTALLLARLFFLIAIVVMEFYAWHMSYELWYSYMLTGNMDLGLNSLAQSISIIVMAGFEVYMLKYFGIPKLDPGYASDIYKEINIHGKINTELDEVDLNKKIIYEDKDASRLYMENPDFPQTEMQWAEKQILKKGSNRIEALMQENFTVSSTISTRLPAVEKLKEIRNFVFRISEDTPELREAVQLQLNKLKELYPEYSFSATYGGD